MARELLLGKGTPAVTEPMLTDAVTEIVPSRDNGLVYLAVDERHLLRFCGHYMVYGSEALAGIAARLTRRVGWNVQRLLCKSGTPTMLIVDVPCSYISSEIPELKKRIFEELHNPPGEEPTEIDFTFAVRSVIPPTAIVGYYSLIRVHDPLRWTEYVHKHAEVSSEPRQYGREG